MVFKNSVLYEPSILCSYSNYSSVASYMKERYAFTELTSDTNTVYAGIAPDKKTVAVTGYGKVNSTYYFYFFFMDYASYKASSSAKSRSIQLPVELPFESVNMSDEQIAYMRSQLLE